MTTIKFNTAIDDNCNLTILDTTGYQLDNATGFVRETENSVDYKLSEGYFINIIQFNKYKSGLVLVNPLEKYKRIDSVQPIYTSNFTTDTYELSQDGVFTITRAFIVSEEVYFRDRLTSRFAGKTVYYTNGTKLYKVTSNVASETTLTIMLRDTTTTNVVLGSTRIISTCFLNNCYFKLMMALLERGNVCISGEDKAIEREKDLLFMTLESISYLQSHGNIEEIERLIEMVDTCGGACSKLIGSNKCGCNG
jgi:hypothetical protein